LKGVNLKLVLTFLEKIKEFNLLFLIYYFGWLLFIQKLFYYYTGTLLIM